MDDTLVICLLGEITLRRDGDIPLDSLGHKT
jgi:hypothetical protein